MKNKSLSIILSLLMIGALVGGLLLVKQNQNTQKGAYFAGTKLLMMPAEITGEVGDEISTQLFAETDVGAKLSSIDTQICYGNELATEASASVELNKEVLGTLVEASVVLKEGYPCLRLIAIADLNKKPADLKEGMVKVATIKFTAIKAGSGELMVDRTKTKVGGYNPVAGATDSALQVGEITGAKYVINDGQIYCDDGVCPAGYECVKPPSPCPTPGTACAFRPYCRKIITDDSVLNYKVAFANVNPTGENAACVVGWPFQFIVMGGGQSNVYSSVTPDKKEVIGSQLVFSGSLKLTGFNKTNGVAVFVKGPKHLQMKYGKNNQVGPYNQAGGEISLTADAATSPVYDFTQYPMMAGDVVGVNSEAQDGWINGVDFSYVKSKSLIHETTNPPLSLKADLDGNCQVNSNDVNILKISLQAKQGELY
jgi:hypothetical protein